MQQAIAILDSGVGGLTVVKEVMRQLPQEKIIYFGDTARTPYGPRDAEEVKLFTNQIVDYLIQFQPKMIVIACNTATAVALDDIRNRLDIPVLGVISPGARAAIKSTRSGIVGVIGTDGTIRSNAYEQALKTISPTIQVHSLACPQLVPLVEQGIYNSTEALETVRESLSPLLNKPIDCLILGCTHYPFLTQAIKEVVSPDVTLLSSADETAREVSTILYHQGMLASADEVPVHQFFCSGDAEIFHKITESWLHEQLSGMLVVWQVPTFI
ncbi:glutamate racemase [Paenibacillus lutrae]|uniref:Glutamate racemase n=1 Tax=Paenibacillus lutrae TaxID=2078573 RepID=A0A7X3JY08_9BACL|nr:glutamate racemase [Paenibacillus lutrae]